MDFARARNNARQVLFELGIEVKLAMDLMQAQVVSADLEARLDKLIDRSGEREKFDRLAAHRHIRPRGSKLVQVDGSFDPDPIDVDDLFACDIPPTVGLTERRERIRTKIAFLSRIARERVEDTIHSKRSA